MCVARRDKYCTLIVLSTRYSIATYFDSGSARRKNYVRVKSVLDDAIEGYAKQGGPFDYKGEAYKDNGLHKFKHVCEFPMRQAAI